MMVFAFVDLDTSQENTLVGLYSSNNFGTYHGYISIASGGGSILYHPAPSKSGVLTIATNNTDNSSTSYTFGDDVEVLILHGDAVTSGSERYKLHCYNIDGDLIAESATNGGFGAEFSPSIIGGRNQTSFSGGYFKGELIDFKVYSGSDVPPVTTASLQAIGNNYKQFKD
jgi:hypothetical protein